MASSNGPALHGSSPLQRSAPFGSMHAARARADDEDGKSRGWSWLPQISILTLSETFFVRSLINTRVYSLRSGKDARRI